MLTTWPFSRYPTERGSCTGPRRIGCCLLIQRAPTPPGGPQASTRAHDQARVNGRTKPRLSVFPAIPGRKRSSVTRYTDHWFFYQNSRAASVPVRLLFRSPPVIPPVSSGFPSLSLRSLRSLRPLPIIFLPLTLLRLLRQRPGHRPACIADAGHGPSAGCGWLVLSSIPVSCSSRRS